jgi:hypothetical protein
MMNECAVAHTWHNARRYKNELQAKRLDGCFLVIMETGVVPPRISLFGSDLSDLRGRGAAFRPGMVGGSTVIRVN